MVTSFPTEAELAQWITSARSLKSLMRSDPHRPRYHFVAPEGFLMCFDPNGAIFWKGRYHLGYIYQKRPTPKDWVFSEDWRSYGFAWGHVVSTDLIHWSQYPDILDVHDRDPEIGIFSGGAFLSKEGVPHIIYHGAGTGSNFLARAVDDDLKTWAKLPEPALAALNPKDHMTAENELYSTGDPCAWYDRQADAYYQIAGGMKPAIFKSTDMRQWDYLGDVIDKSAVRHHPEEDISCPAFVDLDDKAMVLFISHHLGAQYYLGTFSDDKFHPERHGRMNWAGGTFFSAEHLRDANGRNIIWGWVVERKPAHLADYGWSGIMSLPRVVSLGDDGGLRINPPDELKRLRLQERREADIELVPNSEHIFETRGNSLEFKLEISGAVTSPVGVKLFASLDGREETIVAYDPVRQELVIDFSKSSIHGPVAYSSNVFGSVIAGHPERVSEQRAPLVLSDSEPLKLDIYLDRAVLEVFANGSQCVTQVVYPELDISTAITIFSGSDAISVREIWSWEMAETNPC